MGGLHQASVFSALFSLCSSQRGLAKPSAKHARAALARRMRRKVVLTPPRPFFLALPATACDGKFPGSEDGLVFPTRRSSAEWLALKAGCGRELLARISHPMHGQVVEVRPFFWQGLVSPCGCKNLPRVSSHRKPLPPPSSRSCTRHPSPSAVHRSPLCQPAPPANPGLPLSAQRYPCRNRTMLRLPGIQKAHHETEPTQPRSLLSHQPSMASFPAGGRIPMRSFRSWKKIN